MKYSLIATAAVTLSVVAAGVLSHSVSAATSTTTTNSNCTLTVIGTKNTAGNPDSKFVLSSDGKTATVKVKVSGEGCDTPVTLVSWQAPDAVKGQPYSEQKLFAEHTTHLKSGTTALSIELPDCFYQVDLVPGTSPTDSLGGPQYFVNGGRHVLASLHGGTQTCTTPTPPVTPPVTPVQPTVLPNTGTGANVAIAALLAGVAGAIGWNIRTQRKLNR